MMKAKLVCFDLDDTIIREVHSVMLPCILNSKEKEHAVIQELEEKGAIDYITADYLRAESLLGLEEKRISQCFLETAKPLKNIAYVVDVLHRDNIKCILITVRPKQVAEAASDIWGFDGYYGSEYEVIDGVFTGKILSYITADQKVKCLQDFCSRNNIKPEECVGVGDGATDIPIFEYCGRSIALNGTQRAKEKAMYAIDTDDLADILEYII